MSDDTLEASRVIVAGLVKGPVYVIEYDETRMSKVAIEDFYGELRDAGISFVLVPSQGGRALHIHEPQGAPKK